MLTKSSRILYASIFLLQLCLTTRAGLDPVLLSAQADFKKANEFYQKTPNISMDTYYMVFSEHESQSLLEGQNGKYIRYNGNIYVQIDNIETIAVRDKIIAINEDEKMISIGDNHPGTSNPLMTNVDSLLTMCSKVEAEQINATEKKYKLFFSGNHLSEFSQVDIHIDTRNYRFLKVVLFYTIAVNLKSDFYAEEKQPRLEIVYKNFKVLTADPLIFNQNLYILEDREKIKPSTKYSSYKISDLRNKTRIKKAK